MKIDLTFWLIMALLSSVSANFIAFYYIRVVLGRLLDVGENLEDLSKMVASYRNHLSSVYEMEMFYGDETLKFLIEHTRSLYEILEEYEDVYSIISQAENKEELDEESEEENEEEELDAQKKTSKENVFYTGSRTGNN